MSLRVVAHKLGRAYYLEPLDSLGQDVHGGLYQHHILGTAILGRTPGRNGKERADGAVEIIHLASPALVSKFDSAGGGKILYLLCVLPGCIGSAITGITGNAPACKAL